MTRKEETYVLDTLAELQDFIRGSDFKRLTKETHENNIMLRQIIEVLKAYLARHSKENEEDFNRNVLANIISGMLDFGGLQKFNKR